MKKNQIGGFKFENQSVLVSRTGYTGEDGFEIIGGDEAILHAWNKVLEIGKPFGIKPAASARATRCARKFAIRFTAMNWTKKRRQLKPGVGFFVSLDKGEFNGREILAEQKANGVTKKLVAFKMTDKSAPPRPHYPICSTATRKSAKS